MFLREYRKDIYVYSRVTRAEECRLIYSPSVHGMYYIRHVSRHVNVILACSTIWERQNRALCWRKYLEIAKEYSSCGEREEG